MKRGFTLVVVLIIGILAAIALPQYQKAVGKARFATIKPLTEELRLAAQVYYLANGSYPTSLDDLDITKPSGIPCHITGIYTMCYTYVGKYKLQYQIHNTNNSRLCIAFSTDKLPNDICRNETGDSPNIEEKFSSNGYVSYGYH